MLNKNIYIYLLYVYTSMIPVNIQSLVCVCMYIVDSYKIKYNSCTKPTLNKLLKGSIEYTFCILQQIFPVAVQSRGLDHSVS